MKLPDTVSPETQQKLDRFFEEGSNGKVMIHVKAGRITGVVIEDSMDNNALQARAAVLPRAPRKATSW